MHDLADDVRNAFAAACDERLPLNRKERWFTGSVLPGLVARDGLAHLPRFLQLCGVDVEAADGPDWRAAHGGHIQFFSEYGFADSLVGPAKERFADPPRGGDTPDLVVVGRNWLLAVEAKVYHRPTAADLDRQMNAQKAFVEYWAKTFHLADDHVRHVLLLPKGLADEAAPEGWPVVTWEAVRDAYAEDGDPYWLGVLRVALDRWTDLVSDPPTFGANAHAHRTGQEILDDLATDAPEFPYMGRDRGINGTLVASDVETGTWRTRPYEVRRTELPGKGNWFPAEAFRQRLRDAGAVPAAPHTSGPSVD